MKIIQSAWESYKDKVIPKEAGSIQLKESKLAFFAGAGILFYFLVNVMSPGGEVTESDMQKMRDIQKEIEEFKG